MANIIQWDAAANSEGIVLASGTLASIADGSRSNAGTEYDNSVDLNVYGMLETNIQFGSAPDGDASIIFYMVTAPDGTNYSQGSSSVDPGPDTMVTSIKINASTDAQRKVSKPFLLPPTKLKFIAENQTGQSFPTDATVELFTWNEEVQ